MSKKNRACTPLKERKAKLASKKKLALGGAKLDRTRKYAQETYDWAIGAADKMVNSVERANKAVAKLIDYEVKLNLPEKKRLGITLVTDLEFLTEAAETAQELIAKLNDK